MSINPTSGVRKANSKEVDGLSTSNFSEIWQSLTHPQRHFVIAMTQHSTKREAALAIDLRPDTVYRWPPSVDQAVSLMMADILQAAWDVLRHAAAQAAFIKSEGLTNPDDKVRQQAATEILNRILGRSRPQPAALLSEDDLNIIVRYVDENNRPLNSTPNSS